MTLKRTKVNRVIAISYLLFFGFSAHVFGQKLSAEEIIAKHLQALGQKEPVAKMKLRLAIAASKFYIPAAAKKTQGRAVFASNGDEMAFYSTFEMIDYPTERIGLFKQKVDIPFVQLGRRSPLGTFLTAYDKTLRSRIFGGVVFSTWRFGSSETQTNKIESDGKKKIGNREAWVIKFTPDGGLSADSSVKLYFDAQTFYHLRTVYRQKETERGFHEIRGREAGTGQVPGAWEQDMAANASTLTENFDDFRDESGVTLPHKYELLLSVDGVKGTSEFRWEFEFSEYRAMVEFPPNFFSFTNARQ